MSTLETIKINAAVSALVASGLNQSKAAKQLGISRGALRGYLTSYIGEDTNKLSQAVLTKHLSTLTK